MLKNDMRKYMLEDKTFEQFIADYGEEYSQTFTMEIMEKCWKNTKKLLPRSEWLKYLKNGAAQQVKYLTMVTEAMNEEGVNLRETRAGYMLNELIRKQLYAKQGT